MEPSQSHNIFKVQSVISAQRVSICSYHLFHPTAAMLEIEEYSKSSLIEKFSVSAKDRKKLSVSLFLFIDSFGLYQNTYRLLQSFYLTLTYLPVRDQLKQVYVHPITLGPHGCNFANIITSLEPSFMCMLNELKIKSKESTSTL